MKNEPAQPSDRLVRAVTGDDVEVLRRLAVENGLFARDELDEFDQVLAGYLDGSLENHFWLVLDDPDGSVDGAAYYAAEPFGDRVWNLYFLAAATGRHRAGAGSALIGHVETDLRSRGEHAARVLIVETSGLDGYEQARRFYVQHGFDVEARVRDFYGPGDHKVVFWKSLVAPLPSATPATMQVSDEVPVARGDVSAVSRLLWSIGSEQTTCHQHRVDCFVWGAKLDHVSGLSPHPTPGEPTQAVRAFYRDIRSHLDDVIASLADDDTREQ